MTFTLTIGSVECERSFSKQNLIKNYLRNRMGTESLIGLICISSDGSSIEEMDHSAVLKDWKDAKKRNCSIVI